jgi:2-succinyl-5-enolpyruvyl-6-hydroxy-3-cyclohexene-1-carboxylate synthase
LFDYQQHVHHYCNRGTSGIEGSTSTALGFASQTEELTFVVTGDVSFFYDSNAFFHLHTPKNLKVIVVNNSGGGIFRFIPGPGSTQHLESVFESKHKASVKGIAEAHGIDYESIENANELIEILPQFMSRDKQSEILEIRTPDVESADTLKEYFKVLTNG